MSRNHAVSRRTFLESTAATAMAVGVGSAVAAEASSGGSAESLVAQLHDTLSDKQKKVICFDWDHMDPERGLLRTYVSANWNITEPEINDEFYTNEQRKLIRDLFESIIHPSWHERYDQQLDDDAGGFGNAQSIAIFGKPGAGKYELVMTGRHMTLRCDGDSADHVAFGGPIFYGHAPDFDESPEHPGNVFWHQAQAANKLYQMLDGKQQKQALVATAPKEQAVAFQGKGVELGGLPVGDMSSDQREHLQGVLKTLTDMYRTTDQDEVTKCIETQGGLDACSLSFFQDKDIGNDGVWDVWRLEGPSFVWHYRGAPHVHVWVNVADSADVKLNA